MKFSSLFTAGTILLALVSGPALAGQSSFALGPSVGTASAQKINVPSVTSMSDLMGTDVSWIVGAGLTDTGPTTVSIKVSRPSLSIA